MEKAFKHVIYSELVIDKIDHDKLSFEHKEFFKETFDSPRYKFLEEKGKRMSFIPRGDLCLIN